MYTQDNDEFVFTQDGIEQFRTPQVAMLLAADTGRLIAHGVPATVEAQFHAKGQATKSPLTYICGDFDAEDINGILAAPHRALAFQRSLETFGRRITGKQPQAVAA